MPRVSLVIATYNGRDKLPATLDSVAAQTRPPDEVIVVDDYSPDGTGDWLKANYPHLTVVRPERNGGTSASRNLGAKSATGDWLFFLDHDDVLLPHAVATLLELADAFPAARAVYADHRYENRSAGVTFENHHTEQAAFRRLTDVPVTERTPAGRLFGLPLHDALLHGNLLQQPWMIRAEAFRAVGGFRADVRYVEDWDLYLRVTRRYPIALSDAVISTHVLEGENQSLSPVQWEMHRRVLDRLLRSEWNRPRAAATVARRLAMYHKTAGDAAYPTGLMRAWGHYLRSFALWPFDATVAVGALTAFAPWWLTGRKRAVPDLSVPLPQAAK